MSKAILFYDHRSPPARAVLLLIKMLNIDVNYNFIDLFQGEQYKAEYLKINPLHAVPALKHNNLLLTDSHAILIHLCEKFDRTGFGMKLWPKDYEQRMLIMNKLFFNCFYLFSRDSSLMSDIVAKGFTNIDIHHHERKIYQGYNALEEFLEKNDYMAGAQMSLADIAILTTVSTTDVIFPISVVAGIKWPRLLKWYQQMKTIPEYHVNSDGLDKLYKKLEDLGKIKLSNIQK